MPYPIWFLTLVFFAIILGGCAPDIGCAHVCGP